METKPTRRTFFGHAGAALAVPLATAVAATAAAEAPTGNLAARLAALEDAAAIRAVLHLHAHNVTAGSVAAPDPHVRALHLLDADLAIEVGDGTATVRGGCNVETATPIDGRETLVEMARLQGDGVVKRHERRMLIGTLAKRSGAWQIERLELRA